MPRAKKIATTTTIRVKARPVAEEAVEAGVARGIRQFFKHREDEPPEGLEHEIARSVLGEIGERFDFGPNDT
jgi:hypothetical protein